jgi:hypothetical protein
MRRENEEGETPTGRRSRVFSRLIAHKIIAKFKPNSITLDKLSAQRFILI